jgi:hypothetical protein
VSDEIAATPIIAAIAFCICESSAPISLSLFPLAFFADGL